MLILYSFEENKLVYEDEDEVEIKMMGTGMDKESLEHNLFENDITLISFHNFSPTSNPPIKPKDSVYHPQNHPYHYTQNSSTKSQQAATRNRGKANVNSPPPTYDHEPEMVAEDDALSKEKEIDKIRALIFTFPSEKSTNLPTTTFELHQTPVEPIRIILQESTELNAEHADWRDDTDDEPGDQELEAHDIYMAQIQEVTLYVVDNSGPIYDTEPLQKVHNNDDNYNVFANDREHLDQPKSVNDTYLEEQGDTNITIDSLDMRTNGETVDQDDNDLAKERDLLASLIKKLKCEINDSKNCNKFLESSNKTLVDKLKGEIEDFKNKKKV
ncbi:hypothetical protein Tco_0110918 [Tanacetum coccineum]